MPGAFKTDHQTQSDAIRRNQNGPSDAIKIAWMIFKAAIVKASAVKCNKVWNHDYLDHLEGGRGLVHRYEGRPKRRVPDEGGNQTSSE